jgi:CubicO group peptidase (beta-lactamase class C family)
MNYVLAGAMLERVGKKTWEELITERIFLPLGPRSAGLGPQATLGKIDAPLGHLMSDGKTKAFLAGPNGDNPLIIGPAGTAHMSVLDFARWAGWNAGRGKRGPTLVQPETMQKLQTPVVQMPKKHDGAPGTPTRGKYARGGASYLLRGRRSRSSSMAAPTRRTSPTSGLSRRVTSPWSSSRTSVG